jgi:LDH2 family malate/lactate/ureidoglycolate dehydrogenase
MSVIAMPEFRFNHKDIKQFAIDILQQVEVPHEDAIEVAECLIKADLQGVGSHGITRLPVYVKRIRKGVTRARPNISFDYTPGTAVGLVDGDNGLGVVVGAKAMAHALELSAEFGIGAVGVKNSHHFGPASHYVRKAVKQDKIGIATSNVPSVMAPYGGRRPLLGTNPLAVGIPIRKHPALIFDMATSTVAHGKIIWAAQRQEPIPEGWAIDKHGNPTTDSVAAMEGCVLPFGGPKGSALSLIFDVLSGVLTGAAFGTHISTQVDFSQPQNIGHLFIALKIDLFLSMDLFFERMDELIDQLKAVPPAPGFVEVQAPGDPQLRAEEENSKRGIGLSRDRVIKLKNLAKELGVRFPESL